MSEFDKGFCWGLTLGLIVFGLLSYGMAEKNWKSDAVSRGVAEYYIDDGNKAAWRWTVEKKEGAEKDGN